VRDIAGYSARAVVVSDGTEQDLAPLLELENVEFLRPGCAITDLLILARAKVLIASGGSSFSAWASFLGNMPTISYPGQSLEWFKLKSDDNHFVGEFNYNSPSEVFGEQVREIFASK